MIKSLFRRSRRQTTIAALYGMIVAQARSPSFYRHLGVADTVNGRFELVLLHLWLVLHRLGAARQGEFKELAQGIFDTFCADMDAHLRELGTGDMKVPKEMKRVGEAFYGRVKAYDEALATQDAPDGAGPLAQALSRNIFASDAHAGAKPMARYVRAAVTVLAEQGLATVADSKFTFPHPDKFCAELSPA